MSRLQRHTPFLLTLIVAAVCTAGGCGRPAADSRDAVSQIGPSLQRLVEAVVAEDDSIPGAAMYVDAPRIGLIWEGAAGLADPTAGSAMTTGTPVLLASNTKTYVAVSILRLVEQQRLGLDDAIEDHLPAAYVELFRGDGYDTAAITVRHLLTHTAGLFDYADRAIYPARILADPGHRWSRDEQLRGAVEWGDPLAAPGEVYCYSDTDYVLLGSILEQVTGLPLPAAVRELVGYQAVGLDATWFETLEPRPAGLPELAHQLYGTVDSATIDPSSDLYGGGGLAATVGDLGRFMGALFRGRIYERADTLATMLTTVDGVRARVDGEPSSLAPGAYRMGLWQVEIDGLSDYRHSGFWGTSVSYVPDLDVVVAVAINQNQAGAAFERVVGDTVASLRRAIKPGA